jgi:hypothetical protein
VRHGRCAGRRDRKQAKRLAKQEGPQLAAAQRRLGIEYGYKTWADLMQVVASRFAPFYCCAH